MIQKEFVEIESLKSSQQFFVNEFVVINIPKEDVEPKQIINDPDDQLIWECAKNVAPTPSSIIVRPDVNNNFVINSSHLNMIRDSKFDGYLRADPHDHIREFLAICDMFKYGETQSEAIKLLIFLYSLSNKAKTCPNQAYQFLEDKFLFKLDWSTKSQNDHHQKSVSFTNGSDSNTDNSRLMEKLKAMDSQIISLNEELQDICSQNENSHDSYSHQSYHDFEKSLTEINNEVKNDLEDFKRCIRSMRTDYDKLYDKDDHKTTGVLPNKKSKTVNQEPQSKTDFEKSITKFSDSQRFTSMFIKDNINDMILKMKQNEKNFQTIFKNMKRKIDEREKSQNVSSEQTERTNPPPPQAHTEQVNVVFTRSGNIDIGIKLYEWASNLAALELVLDRHLLDRSEHSLLVLRSPKYPKSKKNVFDEEVLYQP
ncbi:hypothetical protein Tco_0014837 [Tanacetum coccineum]